MVKALGLKNVRAEQKRVENVTEKFDFIVSRAVTAFPAFVALVKDKLARSDRNTLPNGILYLKGGDFEEEIRPFAYIPLLSGTGEGVDSAFDLVLMFGYPKSLIATR